MATIEKNLGIVSAYGYAKSKGYTGTEEEFAILMASYATVADEAADSAREAKESADASAESAKAAAQKVLDAQAEVTRAKAQADAALESAGNAAESATAASGSATNAAASATQAQTQAQASGGSAAQALAYKNQAQTYAANAQTSAESAAEQATTAAGHATNAGQAAIAAAESAEASDKSAGVAAESAASVSASAAQIQTNKNDILTLNNKVFKYNDLLGVIKITDPTTTMGEMQLTLASVNADGDHVVFDVAALNAGMYLCTIYLGAGFYRIADLVTGFEATGFYASSDLLYDLIKGSHTVSGKHYTFVWDKVNSKGTRLNDAASITLDTSNFGHFGSVNSDKSNPFDEIYPWSGRKLCNIDIDLYRSLTSENNITDCVTAWEGDANFTYGDQYGVWVYTPPFFGRSYDLGNNRYFDVTDENLPNNIAYPAQITGRYLGVDITLTIDGVIKHVLLPTVGMPLANVSGTNMHLYAKNFGGSLIDIYTLDASCLLLAVEYATMNVQNAIGFGVSNLYESGLHPLAAATDSTAIELNANANVIPGAIIDIGTTDGGAQIARTSVVSVNGTTVTLADAVTVATSHFVSVHGLINVADAEIGSSSGYLGTNGRCNAYYRGEVLFANKFYYVLGAYRQIGTGAIWQAAEGDTDNYDALNTSMHTNTGCVLSSASGYIQSLGLADGLSLAPYCTAVGGNTTNPVGDYCYVPALSAGNTVLWFGGHSRSGANCGLCGNWVSAAGNSGWGSGGRPRLLNP